MSIVVSEDTSWGRAANRFAAPSSIGRKDAFRSRTTSGPAFAGAQTTEFQLLQEGVVDFAIGSTINWSHQVKELNLFALPFLFPSYPLSTLWRSGDPGKRLFKLIEQKGVIPVNGRERLQGADQFDASNTPARGFAWAEYPRGRDTNFF